MGWVEQFDSMHNKQFCKCFGNHDESVCFRLTICIYDHIIHILWKYSNFFDTFPNALTCRIDIVLIFPSLVSEGLTDTGIPRVYEEMGNNFVYYALMSSILYSVIMNLRGRKPDGIPYVSGAADYITGPFWQVACWLSDMLCSWLHWKFILTS